MESKVKTRRWKSVLATNISLNATWFLGFAFWPAIISSVIVGFITNKILSKPKRINIDLESDQPDGPLPSPRYTDLETPHPNNELQERYQRWESTKSAQIRSTDDEPESQNSLYPTVFSYKFNN